MSNTLKILVNSNVRMSRGKAAAQAVHAVLLAYGIHHGGPVIVLGASAAEIDEQCGTKVFDAGKTELPPMTLTAGVVELPDNVPESTIALERAQKELNSLADWAGYNVNIVRAWRPVIEAAKAWYTELLRFGHYKPGEAVNFSPIRSDRWPLEVDLAAAVDTLMSDTEATEPGT